MDKNNIKECTIPGYKDTNRTFKLRLKENYKEQIKDQNRYWNDEWNRKD